MNLNRQVQYIKDSFLVSSTSLILLALLQANSIAYAAGKENKHQHGAHVHGEAVLNLVVEAKTVVVELQTPAVNILGFEHEPSTAEQRKVVEKAVQLLKKYSNVFQLNAGDCRQASLEMEAPFTDVDEHHADKEHTHEHDHAHHDHDSKHKESEDDHEDHESHSEFHVVYQLVCSKPQAISAIEMTVFKNFPGFETVRVQWVGASGQGMSKVSKDRAEVALIQ